MTENNIIHGTPPAVLLPAKKYSFELVGENLIIKLPRKGNYHDLDPNFFDEDAGDFTIFNKENNIFYLPAITKVLFAMSQYPDLPDDHYLAPYAIQIVDDTVVIVGQVLRMVHETINKNVDGNMDNVDTHIEDHKCLKCNATAYEVEQDSYKCSECDFTWRSE